MKLTEDTKIQVYRNGEFLTIGGIWRTEREQILSNQEKAEKYDHILSEESDLIIAKLSEYRQLKETVEKINIKVLLEMLDSLDSYLSKESKITPAANVRRMKQCLRDLEATKEGN